MYIDMHIHSVASDGTFTPDDIIDEIIKKDVSYFSTCDHDSIETSKLMMDKLKNDKRCNDIKYIPGVEITTTFEEKEFHILYYGYDIDNEVVNKYCKLAIEDRRKSENEFISKIESEYPDKVNLEEFKSYTFNPKEGGFKTINYLMEKGVVTRDEYFSSKWKAKWGNKKFSDSKKAIEELSTLNGTVILAHPSYHYKGEAMPKETLDKFKDMGIDGIEAYSPYCNEDVYNYYVEYAKQNNLLVTIGSDCHGSFTIERQIAKPKVSIENKMVLESIKKIMKK